MTAEAATGRIPWITLALGATAFTILMALGMWQLQRLAWKEALLATIDQRIGQAPVELAEVLSSDQSIAAQEYRPVRARGRFHHESERHFLSTWKGQAGFNVYTPLELADGKYLFVNRGFVPYGNKEAAMREQGQVFGPVTVVGLVRAPLIDKPSSILPDNDPAKNVFYWKDIRKMADSAGLPPNADVLPLFVDADATPNPGGLPVGGVTLIDLPNNHLQYAVTWFGLALALLAVLGAWTWRCMRGPAT
ncbi:MAG: SURF1 family protein [Rhizobiaceae bacterium]